MRVMAPTSATQNPPSVSPTRAGAGTTTARNLELPRRHANGAENVGQVAAATPTTTHMVAESGSCSGFLTFVLIAMLLVPVILFAVSAFFGALLMAIECNENKGIAGDATTGSAADGTCSFYEWFKYVLGNLVALATPLTDVSPVSGHVAAEMLDLLIGAWSMSIAGVIYGLIGALTFTTAVVNSTDEAITRRWATVLNRRTVRAMDNLVADTTGMDFDEFSAAASTLPIELSKERLRELFDSYDVDGSGSIDQKEARGLLDQLVKEEEVTLRRGEQAVRFGEADVVKLDARLAEMREMLAALTEAVQKVDDRLASVETRAVNPAALPPLDRFTYRAVSARSVGPR